jgi:hypothetical protein
MGRSTTETGADKAVQIRRSQQKERARILAEISAEQKTITNLNEERAPFAVDLRKVESETGPIKYIAALVYGDNPNTNSIERAVRWIIILIVAVFDPLALVLMLAAQQSLRWAKDDEREVPEEDILSSNEFFPHADEKERAKAAVDFHIGPDDPGVKEFFERGKEVAQKLDAAAAYEPDDGPLTEDQVKQIKKSVIPMELYKPDPEEEAFQKTLLKGYVQNEEQQESDVWTKTISQAEYKEVSEDRRHEVEDWIDRIKTGQISYSDVPEHLLLSVKART